MKQYVFILCAAILILTTGCNRKPKIIEVSDGSTPWISESHEEQYLPDNHPMIESNGKRTSDFHTVKIIDYIPADNYVYAKVLEIQDTIWIAALHQELHKGSIYHYQAGLLQTDFPSPSLNKVFNEIYFVSNLMPGPASQSSNAQTRTMENLKTQPSEQQKHFPQIEGSLAIADLVASPEKYVGSQVQLSGECIKVNEEIMGSNWIHLRDGSMDDYDLVITSIEKVNVGEFVTMTGTVVVDRDLGSGYFYEILIENGKVIKKSDNPKRSKL